MTILPITYLGGIEWFARLAAGECVIDVGEHWVKQTPRNRAEIMTSRGAATLTVPVHGYGAKIATRDVRIDNSKRWQHVHWASLVSAYRNSPFFEHYEERFAPLYSRRFEFLIELDFELLGVIAAALGVDTSRVMVSKKWVSAGTEDLDLRGKKALRRASGGSVPREYTQVFSDRMTFVSGLSIVDLLFNEGPSAHDFLRV